MKHLLWFLLLALVVLAGDRLGGAALQKVALNSQFRYARLYAGKANAEILLLGNSRGLVLYEPWIEKNTGKSTFNLSYNGLPMELAQALAGDYLDRYPAPERLIIDITICDRHNDPLLSGFSTYTGASPRLDALLEERQPAGRLAGDVTHLYRFNNEIFQRALFHARKSDKDWLLDRQIEPELARKATENSYPLEVHPELVESLKETVAYARGKGVAVYCVIGPYCPGFRVTQLDDLKQAVEQATGLPVYDYRNALQDPALFGDFMHPNKAGAEKYLTRMQQDGVLP